ncbi:UDP-GlcNAc:betaGal beta-1,3-N-acetylglucosaminyltransferase-like protein 1, partial [Rhincodon typus]|uniref:UDP-GlcNAc:betaGal beta-1,3-N-acetylglucosaminyltransferase-like protein 1 n=1 Tax=Rhincodon typus TaxID=259920 RepID=UPI00202F7F30
MTDHFAAVCNQTSTKEWIQVFTSHGPTVIMPTWFCSRKWFDYIGKFDEGGKGVPEDLLFFYEHLRKGGSVFRVNHCLLLYRYHLEAATHAVLEKPEDLLASPLQRVQQLSCHHGSQRGPVLIVASAHSGVNAKEKALEGMLSE